MKLGRPFVLPLLVAACGTVDPGPTSEGALDIQPRTLPQGLVGYRYEDQNVALQAENARGTATWSLASLAPGLEWLAVEPASGRLTGTPLDLVAAPTPFTVQVSDGTSTAQRGFTLSVSCREGTPSACGVPDAAQGMCVAGSRLCLDGKLEQCQPGSGRPPYQADPDHCGADCSEHCSRTATNRCVGTCVCGSAGGPCAEPAGSCCPGAGGTPETFACVSLQTVDHCGSCQTRCEPRANTTPACTASTCSWLCAGPYRNCNGGDPNQGGNADGCETRIDSTANCGACGKACSSTPPLQLRHVDFTKPVTCSAGACRYACEFGWGDCTSGSCQLTTAADDPDGCERDFQNPASCGGSTQCPVIDNADATCTFVGGAWTCGLVCHAGFDHLPCGSPPVCRPLSDPANCGACGRSCPTISGTEYCSNRGECCVTECDPDAKPPCHTFCTPP